MKVRKRMAIFLIFIAVCVSVIMWAALVAEVRAEEKESWIDYIEIICQERSICPELVEAIIEAESSWNPKAQGFAEHYLLKGKAGPDFCRDMCLYASASAAQKAGERLMDVFQMWAGNEKAPAERQLR